MPWKSAVGPSFEPSSNNNTSNKLENTKSASMTSTEEDIKTLNDTTVKTATLPYKPYKREVEHREDSKKSNPEDANVKAQDPTSEDVKPPPLAGPNVMNIILVSSECAPWSKTGTISFLCF